MRFDIKDQQERHYVGIRKMVPVEKIAEMVDPLFEKVYAYVGQAGGQIEGGALAIYYGEPGAEFDMECAVPLASQLSGEGDIKPGTLSAGKIVVATHRGAYDGLKAAWSDFEKSAYRDGVETGMPCWEEYIVGPESEQDPAKWVTQLVCPVK